MTTGHKSKEEEKRVLVECIPPVAVSIISNFEQRVAYKIKGYGMLVLGFYETNTKQTINSIKTFVF